MKRVHFEHGLKDKDQQLADQEYLTIFCWMFQLIPLLNRLGLEDRIVVNQYVCHIFKQFCDLSPEARFSEREGVCMIANMQIEIPGAITIFVKRILPYPFLINEFYKFYVAIYSYLNQ